MQAVKFSSAVAMLRHSSYLIMMRLTSAWEVPLILRSLALLMTQCHSSVKSSPEVQAMKFSCVVAMMRSPSSLVVMRLTSAWESR